MEFFRKYSPRISMKIFYAIIIVPSIWFFFTATIWGIFILSILLYSVIWIFGDTKPFTPTQLFLWIVDLPSEYKIAVLSSMLTVLGFLAAFHIATMSWKQQMHTELKAHVADEIEEFFNEVSRLITKSRLYAELVIETVNKIKDQQPTPEMLFAVRYVLDQTPHFRDTIDRLSVLSIQVHRILSKNSTILATAFGAIKKLRDATEAFGRIADAMWVQPPYIHPEEKNPLGVFLTQVNVDEYRRFIDCCENNFGLINAKSGGIRGQLLAPVVGLNLSFIATLIFDRKIIRQFIEEYYKSRKDGSNGLK